MHNTKELLIKKIRPYFKASQAPGSVFRYGRLSTQTSVAVAHLLDVRPLVGTGSVLGPVNFTRLPTSVPYSLISFTVD